MTDKLAAAIKTLREARAKATPGVWAWDYAGPGHLLGAYPDVEHVIHGRNIACVLDGCTTDGNDLNVSASKEDRAFIALSANVWDELLDVVEAAYAVQKCEAFGEPVGLGNALSALAAACGEGDDDGLEGNRS